MTILLRLHNEWLQFVPYGKGRIHARCNALKFISRKTICGKPITDEIQIMSEREIDVQKLCQSCYSSLRTYGPQVEMVSESEVHHAS